MKHGNLKKAFFWAITVLLLAGCGTKPVGNAPTAARKTIVLTIDGGGIRGIIPAVFLQAIEAQVGKPCYQLFDLIGGTSTGGILSIGLTSKVNGTGQAPYTASELLNIYSTQGGKIFVKSTCRVNYCAPYISEDGDKGIEPYLRTLIGNQTSLSKAASDMGSLPNSRVRQVFTTTYIVNSQGNTVPSPKEGVDYGPYLFNWYDAAKSSGDNFYLWEAARGTSAAPTYFPVAHVGGKGGSRSAANERWVVDGGVMSNDPAIWGVSEALRTGLAKNLSDIVVISLGTGSYAGDAGIGIHTNYSGNTPDDGNWSYTPWLLLSMYNLQGVQNARGSIINTMGYSVQMAPKNQLLGMQSAGLQYYRLDVPLTKAQSAMDDISEANIKSLTKTANDYISGPGNPIIRQVITVLKAG